MTSDVAIIGMACLFPGAPDLESFWHNVCAGVDAIGDVPPARWDPAFYDPAATAADRFYCRRGGFVDELARFDAAGHGVMPVAARGAEPDQLLTLELATRALADAGYADRPFARARTGIVIGRGNYAGAGRARLEQHVRGAEQLVVALRGLVPSLSEAELARVKAELQAQVGYVPDAAIGLVPNLTASRVANRLDLQGPAFTVDAACASALVAVDQACAELGAGRSDFMLAGGVHLCHDEAFWSVFCQLGALSRAQQIRPFDRRADGILIGEGLGVVLLRRRADAERDGDRIYAVIRGTGVASDGRDSSLMNPRVEGQVLALERAWAAAGLDPASVGLVEAHGTGTPAGDAAELETLRRVFGPPPDRDGERVGLGTVKSMIGHAMPAAGIAGLIKAALAAHHGVLPPTLHCEEPHDAVERTRFRLIARAEEWRQAERRAAVNAFGFGGINAHVVLVGVAAPSKPAPRAEERIFLAAAASPAELALPASAPDRFAKLGSGPCRLAVLDPTPARLERARAIVAKGRPWRGRDGIWFSPRGLIADGGKLAFAFPGVDATSVAGTIEETGAGIVEANRRAERALRAAGVEPDVLLGHSIGEWSAMHAAGMIRDEVLDGFIARARPGALAVPGVVFVAAGCGRAVAEEAMAGLPDIALSHDNCPHQVVLCGVEASAEAALARLRARGVLAQRLPFQSGFHTPLFAGHVAVHRDNFATLPLAPARVPLWSATTCAPYPADLDVVRALAVEHLLAPVRFRELVLALHDAGVRVFVQAGAGSLVQLVEDTLRGRPHAAIAASEPRRALAALWVEGQEVDFATLWPARAALPLDLGVPLVRFGSALAVAPPAPAPAPPGRLASAFAGTLDAIARAQTEVAAALAPSTRTSLRTLSLATMPELIDHTFFRQPEGWSVLSDRHPVVPMTALIALMIEEAGKLAPGRVAVAVEDVRAFRWLVAATPVAARFVCRRDGDRVAVQIDGYAEATVRFAAAYPPAPSDDTAPLAGATPAPHTPEQIYADRWMFHGPAYRGIAAVGPMGADGIRGTLETGAATGALLDNAGQLFGYWVMLANAIDRMAMPVAIARLELYGPHPAPGERLACTVRVRRHDERAVVADLTLGRAGRAWCRIAGWEDRRFTTDERFWNVLTFPERNLLAEPRAGGWVWLSDGYRAAATREQLMRRYLGERERAAYEAQPPLAQRAWLSGRVAAKDAVRDLLWRGGAGPLFPIEIELDGETVVGRDLRVALAQQGEIAVALAARGRPGIAVEEDGDGARVRAALAAAGQARGADPRRLRVADRTDERLLVDGLWVDTRRHGRHVVAWTVSET
jgi:acyl transferase domain-containing protein